MIGTRFRMWTLSSVGLGGLLLSGATSAFAKEETLPAPPSTEAASEASPAEQSQPDTNQDEARTTEVPPAAAQSAEVPLDDAAAASGDEPSAEMPAELEPSPRPVVSTLDFEGAAYLSVAFAELPVPEAGSLHPVGGGAYAAIRYVPATFPFHAYFQTGGGLFATGTTTGPSGTAYSNVLSALFFSPGVGLDLGALRLTIGLGPALVFTSHSTEQESSSSTSLAFSGDVGISYRFFEKTPWALSAALRYQTVPGAKIDALSLGIVVRFGSVGYR